MAEASSYSGASSAMAAMPSPSSVGDTSKAANLDFHPSIPEDERRFYLKAYASVDNVRDRKVHCTVCKTHIGTAPAQEANIKMHPILRVTHCLKCHDFYNSGEFSKGEDGSELYCRWCGQGGEVYCCSSCPYVFCKSCIVKNLFKGVVADIEQNENWNCFSCAPKILWPLRAQHWALMQFIDQQKKELSSLNLSENEYKIRMNQDRSKCCRLAKAKCGNMSDSLESLDSVTSKRSHSSTGSAKKPIKHSSTPSPSHMPKRAKTNDEVVCTPDLISMLEPDCQLTVAQKANQRPTLQSPAASVPRIMSIQPTYGMNSSTSSTPKTTAPPPLVLRNTAIKLRPAGPTSMVRRTVIGPRTPNPSGSGTPVYHTINGYRIDLNSAAQQDTFRLPNGKLIQVKRQGPPPAAAGSANTIPSSNSWHIQSSSPQQSSQRIVPQTIASRPVQITQHPYPGPATMTSSSPQQPQMMRFHGNSLGSTTIIAHNGPQVQLINGQMQSPQPTPMQTNVPPQMTPGAPIRPVMVRHIFPNTAIGKARSQLQDQVFNAMEICTHLTNKVQTLTNSNAYKTAKSDLEIKELYIHLSYVLTYSIGRFKGLQDNLLNNMRQMGFTNDADCLENGQLAADKQASDDEDNEIEIVEPKTDLITLDSDDDDEVVPEKKPNTPLKKSPSNVGVKTPNVSPSVKATKTNDNDAKSNDAAQPPSVDLMSMAHGFLASMLEVEISEDNNTSTSSDSPLLKKQPRKKMTNKPNPTLLKQKARMERERLEDMKRNDQKLKMKCSVQIRRVEEELPIAKRLLLDQGEKRQRKTTEEIEADIVNAALMSADLDKDTVEVNVLLEDTLNSSFEDNRDCENSNANEMEPLITTEKTNELEESNDTEVQGNKESHDKEEQAAVDIEATSGLVTDSSAKESEDSIITPAATAVTDSNSLTNCTNSNNDDSRVSDNDKKLAAEQRSDEDESKAEAVKDAEEGEAETMEDAEESKAEAMDTDEASKAEVDEEAVEESINELDANENDDTAQKLLESSAEKPLKDIDDVELNRDILNKTDEEAPKDEMISLQNNGDAMSSNEEPHKPEDSMEQSPCCDEQSLLTKTALNNMLPEEAITEKQSKAENNEKVSPTSAEPSEITLNGNTA